MTPLRIALVGLDHWYTALPLAEGVAQRDGMVLAGVWYAEPERAAALGLARVEPDWRRLVDSPGVDAVLSFTSPDLNHEVCREAAAAGKHVIANKPLARHLDDASAVVAEVRRAGVHLLPAESRQRLGPRLALLRQWLTDGRIGRVTSAALATWAGLPQRWPDQQDPGWFADPYRTAGGGWIDHAIYQVDALRWLLGAAVTSMTGTVARHRHPDLAVEDYGVATATFAGGVIATLEDTWTAPDGRFQASTTLVGDAGAVRLDGLLGGLHVLGPAGWEEQAMPPPHDQAADLDHFAAVIRGEREPVATVEDAWHNLAACLAFYEAARTGHPVTPDGEPR